jgi:predicted MFS family arabinose efflux permease
MKKEAYNRNALVMSGVSFAILLGASGSPSSIMQWAATLSAFSIPALIVAASGAHPPLKMEYKKRRIIAILYGFSGFVASFLSLLLVAFGISILCGSVLFLGYCFAAYIRVRSPSENSKP